MWELNEKQISMFNSLPNTNIIILEDTIEDGSEGNLPFLFPDYNTNLFAE